MGFINALSYSSAFPRIVHNPSLVSTANVMITPANPEPPLPHPHHLPIPKPSISLTLALRPLHCFLVLCPGGDLEQLEHRGQWMQLQGPVVA